jgi:hypothetical protein
VVPTYIERDGSWRVRASGRRLWRRASRLRDGRSHPEDHALSGSPGRFCPMRASTRETRPANRTQQSFSRMFRSLSRASSSTCLAAHSRFRPQPCRTVCAVHAVSRIDSSAWIMRALLRYELSLMTYLHSPGTSVASAPSSCEGIANISGVANIPLPVGVFSRSSIHTPAVSLCGLRTFITVCSRDMVDGFAP